MLIGLALGALGVWALNTSRFVDTGDHVTKTIAHRGVHQIYAGADRDGSTCRASPVKPNTHHLIENTIASMQAAQRAGADVVELDVHLTRDGQFAVFHDWHLDCLTDGQGVTHQQTMAYLKTLDIGFGYSFDGTQFPLRGSGIGQMPSLRGVLDAELPVRLLINFKSKRRSEGEALSRLLYEINAPARIFGVYGGRPPTEAAQANSPGLRGYHKRGLLRCLGSYVAIGWTGHVPRACRNTFVGVPQNYAPYLWGWPHRFSQRLRRHGSEVILFGPYDGSGFTSGIDTLEALSQVPDQFDGYIWTNRIERIGPALRSH